MTSVPSPLGPPQSHPGSVWHGLQGRLLSRSLAEGHGRSQPPDPWALPAAASATGRLAHCEHAWALGKVPRKVLSPAYLVWTGMGDCQ